MIEKIGLVNRTDIGDFPISVKITNGATTTYLAKNLIIPRYSTVDILDRHKRIETNAKIEVEVGSTNTIDVIISGKKITLEGKIKWNKTRRIWSGANLSTPTTIKLLQ